MRKFFNRLQKGKSSRESSPNTPLGSYESLKNVTDGNIKSVQNYLVDEKDLPKLHKAVWKEDLKKVRNLVRREPMTSDKENRTPLHYACCKGNEDIVRELLEFNAKVNVVDQNFQTPIMKAVQGGFVKCITLLMDYKADLTLEDANGNAAIHHAVNSSSAEIVSLLIKAGVCINTHNQDGMTSLHLAVEKQDVEMVNFLLKNGADVDCVDNCGRSALMLACLKGDNKITETLMNHGASTNLKDKDGYTASELALQKGYIECQRIISITEKTKNDTINSESLTYSDVNDEFSHRSDQLIQNLEELNNDCKIGEEKTKKMKKTDQMTTDKPIVPPSSTSSESRLLYNAYKPIINEEGTGHQILDISLYSGDDHSESHEFKDELKTTCTTSNKILPC
ncbi:unnamed protein product [Heterobilharzia americana]|nr:unnamed protein product [Heterobilharzia americana]